MSREFEVTSIGTTTIGVKITGLDPTYSAATRQCDWAVSTDESRWIIKKHDDSIAAYASEHASTITGLTPDTTYYLKAFITNIQGSDDVEVVYNGTVTTGWNLICLDETEGVIHVADTVKIGDFQPMIREIYRFAVEFEDSGRAIIALDPGRYESESVYIYITTSSSKEVDRYGQPTSNYARTSNSNSNDMRIQVEAGITYYIWMRLRNATTTAASHQFALYAKPPGEEPEPETEEGIYIYNGSRWVKATAYIYTSSSGWVKATPYIYSGNTWKKA